GDHVVPAAPVVRARERLAGDVADRGDLRVVPGGGGGGGGGRGGGARPRRRTRLSGGAGARRGTNEKEGHQSTDRAGSIHARSRADGRATIHRACLCALDEQRVVKATLMRATLHLVSSSDYPTFLSAVHGGEAPLLRPEEVAYGERVAPAVRKFLEDGPRSRGEVFELLQEFHGLDPDHPTPWGLWFAIRSRAHVVHAPESAFRNAGPRMRYVALREISLPDPSVARVELVRRYLQAFGPATRPD